MKKRIPFFLLLFLAIMMIAAIPARKPRVEYWWGQANWYVDPANVTGLANDANTGADATHPLRHFDEIHQRWGTWQPLLTCPNGATTIWVMSGQAPEVDQVYIEPRVENGCQFAVRGLLNASNTIQTGTLSGVTQISKSGGGTLAQATFGVGLTVGPEIVYNNTRATTAWLNTLSSGTTFNVSNPVPTAQVPYVPGLTGNAWANGDSYTVYQVPCINLKTWHPVWGDLRDTPDTRATLVDVCIDQGIDGAFGNGDQGEAQVTLDGSAIQEVYVLGSGSFVQVVGTHGSRAGGIVSNVSTFPFAARFNINGLESLPAKEIVVVAGQFIQPSMTNVFLQGDTIVTNAQFSGLVQFTSVYWGGALDKIINGSVFANSAASTIWGPGALAAGANGTIIYPSGAGQAAITFPGGWTYLTAVQFNHGCLETATGGAVSCNVSTQASNLDTVLGATIGCVRLGTSAVCNTNAP